MNRRDAVPLLLILGVFLALLSPVLFTHRTYFLHDLTNINCAWRTLVAEQLERGHVPLWNPYAIMGLPLLGNFQTGIFFPVSLLFDIFPFPQALGFYLLAAYMIGAGGAYLWFRSLRLAGDARLGRLPALAGTFAFTLSGYLVSHMQFPNLLGTLVWLPAFFLLSESPWLLALASALSFYSGYLPIWGELTAALFALRWIYPRRRSLVGLYASMAGATVLAIALGAAVLLPGLELIRHSTRAAGTPFKERTELSYEPYELSSLIRPGITRAWSRARQTPHVGVQSIVWEYEGSTTTFRFVTRYVDPMEDQAGAKLSSWKSGYEGVIALAVAIAGYAAFWMVAPTGAAGLAGYVAVCCLLLLGYQTRLSGWVWAHWAPLRFVRGPGRLSYLLLAANVPMVAVGAAWLARRGESIRRGLGRWTAVALTAGIVVELFRLGCGFYPTMPKDYFYKAGPLIEFLRANLDGDRYYQYTAIEVWPYLNKPNPNPLYHKFKEVVYQTYRQKLFGISNAPFHLEQATAEFEPLLPVDSSAAMQPFRAEKEDPAKVESMMRWADIRFLTNQRTIFNDLLIDRGRHIWNIKETPQVLSRAYWLPASWRDTLSGSLEDMPLDAPAVPWRYSRPREDRLRIMGAAPEDGMLYLAEPHYPGWEAYVNGRRTPIEPALTAFSMMRVPAGPTVVDYLYRPASWRRGRGLTLFALAFLALLGLRRTEDFL